MPQNRVLLYGKWGDVTLNIVNDGPRVVVRSIEAIFPCDDGLAPYVARHETNDLLAQHASESYCIPIRGDLRLPPGTQTFHFIVRGEIDGFPYAQKIDPVNHFEFRPRPGGARVFISHKIPEDTPLAEDLARYLARAGFECYLAEHDKRPGFSLWDKIRPELDRSAIVVALCTRRADGSAYMRRELARGRAQRKPVYIALEAGATLPDGTPKGREWDPFETPLDREAMAKVAERILENDRLGRYRAATLGGTD